jgi:hypothetical protein
MMALHAKLSFTAMSTALLISIVALPVSVIAFAVLYANYEPFWATLWMLGVLPTIWVVASVLIIRDAVKRRSRPQIAGVIALLVPTVLLVNIMVSPRFAFHQLFTFRPLDLHIPANGLAFIQKFPVCAEGSPCASREAVTETRTFRLAKVPDGCCSLQVVNGRAGKHKVQAFRVILNGKEVNLPARDSQQITTVTLGNNNVVSVRLSGASDAYIYVVVWYMGRKGSPPA